MSQFSPPGGNDAYVAKLNTNGGLVFSTYLGGRSADSALGIAVDRITGSAVLTGLTASTNFPTTGVTPATTLMGTLDAFVVQLNPAGSAFSYARYLGGDNVDVGMSVAMDSSGAVYVTGGTYSSAFPIGGPANHGNSDIYVVKLNP